MNELRAEVAIRKRDKSDMKEIRKIVLKYDTNKNIYLINDKEVEEDVWILAKSTWETAQSYNNIKRYVDKWGFTSHDYYTKDNVYVWVFTTVQK